MSQMTSPSKILIRLGGMVRRSSSVELQATQTDLSLVCNSTEGNP